jgi:antitoxin (DNA-binding transcriptional repressor) of toxin-antitoxin stability system
MKFRSSTIAFLVATAFAGGLHAADVDEAAALTGEIQRMDASATSKGQGAVTGRIVSDFESFAGSKENSASLVNGLRGGSEITLTAKGEPSATFTPPTRPMGYGNVSTSLALAKFQLAQQGIMDPTPAQLQTALMGGTITANGKTVAYEGILQMRADGMGWGQIAHSVGTKLGPVVSGIKAQNTHLATLPAARAGSAAGTTVTATGASSKATPGVQPGDKGASSTRGVVTAAGTSAGAAHGNAKGAQQVTTAAGGASAPRGQGIVTAAGHGASPNAQGVSGTQGGGGVVNATGGAAASSSAPGQGGGQGKALGHAK